MPLQVSTKSWHYRYQRRMYQFWDNETVDFFNPRHRTNLCSYMRGFVYCTMMYTFIAVTVPFWGPVAVVFFPARHFWQRHKASLPVLVCGKQGQDIGWCEGTVHKCRHCGLSFCRRHLRWHDVEHMKPKMQSILSLTWEYTKAKKQKICPVIEFVDPIANQ